MFVQRKRTRHGFQILSMLTLCIPWTPARAADTATGTEVTRTRHLIVSGRLESSGECRSRVLGVTLSKDRTAHTGSATVTTLRTLLEFSDFDWCTGFNRTITAEWPNLAGSNIAQDLNSASVLLNRTVTLSECTSSAEGSLSCSERAVPVSISISLVANGDYSTGRDVRVDNTSGTTVRLADKTRQNQANVSYTVSVDGEAQTYDLAYGSLSSDLTKETL
jgi:hypothetical protein